MPREPIPAPEPAQVEAARAVAVDALRIVALTGAGISTDSGIPDFRGPNGVWTRNPEAERLSTLSVYLADPEVRRRAWLARLDHPAWAAEPNPAHLALAAAERAGRLDAVITQNIDGLHVAAGNDPGRVIEVHGTMRRVRCTACGWEAPMQEVLDRVRAGEADPPCPRCGGILKSATVFFGEGLDPDRLRAAFEAAVAADLLIAVGTTLQVYPVADVVPAAVDAGVPVLILNAEPTAMDHLATVVVRGSITNSLPAILA